MTQATSRRLGTALALVLLTAATAPPATQDNRARALVAQMTLDEKFALLRTYYPSYAAGNNGVPADIILGSGYMAGVPRLGIPPLNETDASLGVSNMVEMRKGDVATALPAALATAASFDPAIAYAGGAMIGAEARAKTFGLLLAGGVNLTRDPWAGRDFEYFGEDPLLAGRMAGATIAGVQSNHIASTVKHFALNPQETGRLVYDARLAWPALRESDLLAFEIAIGIGHPASVMCAYNRVNGPYACENPVLLTDILRTDWHYPGWVMSDWGATHSAATAALAGLDQESGVEYDPQIFFDAPLRQAVAKGEVPALRIDRMATRIVGGLLSTGLLDTPVPASQQPIDYPAHADVAQRVAEAGIVLLRNEGALLPLAASARRIAVIGGHADVGVLSGGGSSQVRSVGGAPIEIPVAHGPAASYVRETWHASSPLEALRAARPDAAISFTAGDDRAAALAAARNADVVILFATQWRTEEMDIPDLHLPDGQDALIAAIAQANPRLVVVLETGGPVLMPWIAQVPAVLEAWYPGQRGGEAIAAVLTGRITPSGHLPITFPQEAEQAPRPAPVGLTSVVEQQCAMQVNGVPDADQGTRLKPFAVDYREGSDVGYRWYARTRARPLFAFGHGLSYTTFRYSHMRVTGGNALTIRFDITNAGARGGTAVPQVYVTPVDGGWPIRLAGFQSVRLLPGERRSITITANRQILATWDEAAHGWLRKAGRYRIDLGESSDAPLTSRVAWMNRARWPSGFPDPEDAYRPDQP